MEKKSTLERYAAKFPKSRALYEKAKLVFPRGVTHDNRFVGLAFPIYITHGRGSHKWDADGYEYIDYFGGHGALMLGHAHPSLVQAVNDQIAKGTHYGACHELEVEWAELIRRLLPSAERIEFTSSGTEANMLGIRVARAFTGRDKMVRFRGQMGGWYDALTVGNAEPWEVPTTGGLPAGTTADTISIPANDEKALEEALRNRDVAVLVCEPAGSYSGVDGIAPSFFAAMTDLTARYGTLLLFDEVVTGFRYASGGVQTERGLKPDLTTLGKNITGGLPGAGALAGRADVMDVMAFKDGQWNRYKRVSHQGTFNANPLCAAAGIATLKILGTGEPQRRATGITTLLSQGMEKVLKEKRITGCAYNEFSSCHLYIGECGIREKCDRVICLNASKVRPGKIGEMLGLNLTLNGIHTSSRGVDYYPSAVHDENDVKQTIRGFERSLDAIIEEGVLKAG